MTRITKDMKIEAIQSHFRKQGGRVTNLSRVNMIKIDEFIQKYNINVAQYFIDLETEKNIELEKKRIEKEKQEQFEREMKQKWDRLTNDEKESCYMIIYDERFAIDVDNESAILHNIETIKTADEFERRAIQKMGELHVKRINDNTISVRGINSLIGYLRKIYTDEDIITHKNEQLNYIKSFPENRLICDDLISEHINNLIKQKEDKSKKVKKVKKIKNLKNRIVIFEIECEYVIKTWAYDDDRENIEYTGLFENDGIKNWTTEEEARKEFEYAISGGAYCSLYLIKIDPNKNEDRETCIDEWEDL